MLPVISSLYNFKTTDSDPSSTRRNQQKSAKKSDPFRTSYFSTQKLIPPSRTVSPVKTPNGYKNHLPTIREHSIFRSNSNEFDEIYKYIKKKSEFRNSDIGKDIEFESKLASSLKTSSAKQFNKTVSYASKIKLPTAPEDKSQSVKKIVKQNDLLFNTEITADKYFNTDKLVKKNSFKKQFAMNPETNIKFTSLTDRKRSTRRDRSPNIRRINSHKEFSRTLNHDYISELERISVLKFMPKELRKTYLSNILLYKSHINVIST